MKPLVSVIIPSYNHKRYIIDCINSVACQDVDGIELIVIDDCSPDGSHAYILKAFDEHKINNNTFIARKIIQNEKNMGAHNTLNRGLSAARGKYISILNSDDQYESNRLSEALSSIVSRNLDFIFTGLKCIDDLSNTIESPGRIFEDSLSGLGQSRFDVEFLRRNPAITSGNFVFKRDLLASGLQFKNLRYCHDWDFLLSAILIGDVGFINKPLYRYRFHESNSFKGLAHIADLETLIVLSDFTYNIYRLNKFEKIFGGYSNWARVYNMIENLQRAQILNLASSLTPVDSRLGDHTVL